MMTADLTTFLLAQPQITLLCGNNIFPGMAPLGTPYPMITMTQTGEKHQRSFAGRSGLASERYTLFCWGSTIQSAETLAMAVSSIIGAISQQTIGASTFIQYAEIETARDTLVNKQGLESLQLFGKELDCLFWRSEPGIFVPYLVTT